MYKYLVALGIAFTLLGCEGSGWTSSDPYYSKDPRTKLCFASVQGGGYANVPCTDEVEEIIRTRK